MITHLAAVFAGGLIGGVIVAVGAHTVHTRQQNVITKAVQFVLYYDQGIRAVGGGWDDADMKRVLQGLRRSRQELVAALDQEPS